MFVCLYFKKTFKTIENMKNVICSSLMHVFFVENTCLKFLITKNIIF